MSNKICDDPTYQNMVLQKSRFQLLNIPPQRYNNLANNPYTLNYPGTSRKFTKQDLDMRRKVEVLKYSANNSSTQTNRFTKAEIYAQVISGKYQQRTYSNSYITENTKNNQLTTCPTIYTPTSACGVPGPVMYLYEDTNVPIYNYTTNTDSNYGILTQGINPYGTTWDYTKDTNKADNSIITSLFIYYNDDEPFKTFTITTPIVITFNGTKIPSSSSRITFNIDTVTTSILYNSSTYTPTQSLIHTFTTNTINIDILSNSSSTFSGTCYLGSLEIKNIVLPIQKGYIFDIKPLVNYTITNLNTNVVVSNLNIIFNPTNFYRSATNCNITGDITNPITPMTVTAT
jgi:hypothetical protein